VKLFYYAENDSLYIELRDEPSVDAREVSPGVVLDFNANGRLVGIDVQRAADNVDLTRLEAVAVPLLTTP
jgi:uncharacterized protein YuzE